MNQITKAQRETDTDYNTLRLDIQSRFAEVSRSSAPLFTTEAPDNLFDIFLFCLPEGDVRQYYTCTACRNFINRFGGLVTVGPRGDRFSALWPHEAPPLFSDAVRAIRSRAMTAPISGVLVSSDVKLGQPTTGPWSHFAVELPRQRLYTPTRIKSLEAAQAEKIQEFQMLKRALSDFKEENVQKALGWLKAGQIPRSERFVSIVEWFLDLQERMKAKDGLKRDDLIWLASAAAPAGFCHIRASVVGTLLQDIEAGNSFETCKRNFADKVDPSAYQRSQTAPDAGNIRRAEAIVEELGLAKSLERRYAKLSDIEALWIARGPKDRPAEVQEGGVFASVEARKRAPKTTVQAPTSPAVKLTWEKFRATVLPEAETMALLAPAGGGRFAALVTAQDASSPPLLQWDSPDRRNPVSWYYHGGVDAEIRNRVIKAGGVHEGVSIRVSLIWWNRNDLDLHCVTPEGKHICFHDKRPSGQYGWLDVDKNVRGETTEPVENIRWLRGQARPGNYSFYVLNYRFHEPSAFPTRFSVELEIDGQVYKKDGEIPATVAHGANINRMPPVFAFEYGNGQAPLGLAGASTSSSSWGVQPGQWTKVRAVTLSPNLWGPMPQTHHGRHVFFLLDGCRDSTSGLGRGFFAEALRSELREVRSTLEAYAAKTPIQGAEGAEACGVGFKEGGQGWADALLRVTDRRGIQSVYQLDRWD